MVGGQPITLPLQFRRRRNVYKLKSSSPDGLYSGERLREGLRQIVQRKCQMQGPEGEARIALLRNEVFGGYCKKKTLRKFKIASATQTERT